MAINLSTIQSILYEVPQNPWLMMKFVRYFVVIKPGIDVCSTEDGKTKTKASLIWFFFFGIAIFGSTLLSFYLVTVYISSLFVRKSSHDEK